MNITSKLVPSSLKAQCRKGIERLTADNQALDIANQSIDAFICDESIKSISYNSMKQQLNDYKTIIYLLKSANESDISDYEWLCTLVGEDVLSGNVVELKRVCEMNLATANENAQRYHQKACDARVSSISFFGIDKVQEALAEEYSFTARLYEQEAEKYEATISRCNEIIEEYDRIEENSKHLFKTSEPLRKVAHAALLDMQTTFHNNMYVPHQLSEWRQECNQYLLRERFKDTLSQEFGFDNKTVTVLWDVYEAIQTKYPDLPQEERDWYFARTISQIGGYNNMSKDLKMVEVETHAWKKGAGTVFEYGDENAITYFCDELGICLEDYQYMRQMVKLQHLMVSAPNEYSATAVAKKANATENDEEIKQNLDVWIANMSTATNQTYTLDEYADYYKKLYDKMGDKGDFSHMMYTISAGLLDEGHDVENEWSNVLVSYMQWDNMDERKNIAGWLGDAIYKGTNNQVSFGEDDYISDLDADNIVHRIDKDGGTLVSNLTQYYRELSDADNTGKNITRTSEFLKNNPYETIEATILKRIDREKLSDIENDTTYADTYQFLKKLKAGEGEKKNEEEI